MRRLVVLCAAPLLGCATVRSPSLSELKPAVQAFHERVRWKDFRAAAELVVPEHRDAFIEARSRGDDERDLFLTDFQLEDATLKEDLGVAVAVSRVSWYRLPSTTERTRTVSSTFVWRERQWLLESQSGGPFEDLEPPPSTAGAAE